MKFTVIKLVAVLTLALFAAPLAVKAQPPPKINRIGVFAPGAVSGTDQFQDLVKAFREGLKDLGWIEGQSVVIETRWGEGRIDEFPKIASELVARSVDVIVAWGPQAIRATQQATGTVPIVMAIVHEPVAFGFVKSFARPGGNITGLAFQDSELGTKDMADNKCSDIEIEAIRCMSERQGVPSEVQDAGAGLDGARPATMGGHGGPGRGARRHHGSGARHGDGALHHPTRPPGGGGG